MGSPNYEAECHKIIKQSNADNIHNYFGIILDAHHQFKLFFIYNGKMFVKLLVICEALIPGRIFMKLEIYSKSDLVFLSFFYYEWKLIFR